MDYVSSGQIARSAEGRVWQLGCQPKGAGRAAQGEVARWQGIGWGPRNSDHLFCPQYQVRGVTRMHVGGCQAGFRWRRQQDPLVTVWKGATGPDGRCDGPTGRGGAQDCGLPGGPQDDGSENGFPSPMMACRNRDN